jgi:Fe-S cluster assembly iron-binding protein IscA/alpha/beta superfamily hydrolase
MGRLCCLALAAVLLAGCPKGTRPPSAPAPPAAPGGQAAAPAGRKDIVVLTPGAAAQLRKLMGETGARYLRVSVSPGHEYKLDLDERADPQDDYLGESLGVPVVVDRKSSLLIPVGVKVDFLGGNGQTGFSISAPEAGAGPPDTSVSLAEARRGFKTTLARRESGGAAPPEPPAGVLRLVRYDAPGGKSAAYLSPDPGDGEKHPAIVWITGGDCNSIDAGCWQEGPPGNDQSASAYRKAGVVMMFPSLRGGNDSPGFKEGFLGEVDDVLAAADFLARQPYVDPRRVYLGGHSTGGTLALLTAECSDRFRAVFSFGPVGDVVGYGPRYNPFVLTDPKEQELRAPGRWLHSVRSPVFVFEGDGGNLVALRTMARASRNAKVQFFEVKGTDHFGVLAPTNRLIAGKLLADTGPTCGLAFTEEEVNKPFAK